MGPALHTYANMLHMLDGAVGNVTSALMRSGMWARTLVLFTADNGGIGKFGNNYPLRGHKHDPWEGGTRAVAFLAGGSLPRGLRGARTAALVHVSDWYPTFCNLAGADPSDDANISGRVHQIDGVDVWPLLVGANSTQPRALTVVTEASAIEIEAPGGGGATGNGALWKLVTLAGESNYYTPSGEQRDATNLPCLAGRQPDPPQPGRTDPLVNGPAGHEGKGCPVCNSSHPCLFELTSDPNEQHNLAAEPDVASRVERLARAIALANAEAYVSGSLDAHTLAERYVEVDPDKEWNGFKGPCYRRKR